MEKIIDLHIHTNLSDGALSPKEVIDEAVKNGVSVMAIADHDTIEAYNDELFEYAKEKNVKLIKAVEISTKNEKAGIHVLGYNFDINNQELIDKLYEHRNARHIYLHNVSEKLRELGYHINEAELDKIDAVTKAHISKDVVESEENKEKLLKEFGYIPEKGEFIETIMNEGCPAYVKKKTMTPKEAAELIKRAGGKVVLAHPVAYKYEDNFTKEDIEKLVTDMKADGIEANYIYIDRNNKRINELDIWNEFAKKHNLFTTIGSDFHMADGVHVVIGLIKEDINLSNEDIDLMLKNILE